MKHLFVIFLLVAAGAAAASAQPRPVAQESRPKPPPAPESVNAKYEGGMVGFSKKADGTISFDDINERLRFSTADAKPLFEIPYDSLLVIYPQSQAVTSTTGSVVRALPLPGAVLGGFIKEKRRYIVIHYADPDINVEGTLNFRIDDKDLLDSVIQTLADKAEMVARGDAFYRRKRSTN